MTDNEKMLIHIPAGGEYIEILGHRIDGFDSFEAFCQHLGKFAEMEETINRQKETIEQLQTALFKCGEEMVEAVRCKDCTEYNGHRYCNYHADPVEDNDYCSYGERKEQK